MVGDSKKIVVEEPEKKKKVEEDDNEKLEEWKDNSNGILKKSKALLRVVDLRFLVLIVIVAAGVGFFIYFGFDNYFSPTFIDNSTCTNTCDPPDCNCNLSCGTFNATLQIPSNLNLNINSVNYTKYNETCLVGCVLNSTV